MVTEKQSTHLAKVHKGNTTHGLGGTRIEAIWHGIKQRCLNPNNHAYKYYGGRGIKICDRWRDNLSNFLDDMGHPAEGMTIDRIDNNGNYEPSNCRWASRANQMSNRRVNRFLEFDGKRQTAMQWATELGIPHQTIYQRINLGWPVEKILLPEKQINKSGLALGGAANGARNSAKTHCKNGHEFSPQNTGKNGKNGRSCKRCKADKQNIRNKMKRHLTPPC